MTLGALQSWLFFAAIIATALALHWQRPGERGGSAVVLFLRGGVLAALLVGLVQCAQQAERGEALRIRVERLQVPLAKVAPQADAGQDSADPAAPQSAYLITWADLVNVTWVSKPLAQTKVIPSDEDLFGADIIAELEGIGL